MYRVLTCENLASQVLGITIFLVAYSCLCLVKIERFDIDRIVHWPAFASATRDAQAVMSQCAAKEMCAIVFKVRCRSARALSAFSRFTSQQEVIFPPNTFADDRVSLHFI